MTDEELELCQTLAEEAGQDNPADVLAPPTHYENEQSTAPAPSNASPKETAGATTPATPTPTPSRAEGLARAADMVQSPSKEVLIADNSSRR